MEALHINDAISLRTLLESDAGELAALDASWPHEPQLDEHIFCPSNEEGARRFICRGMELQEKSAGMIFGIFVEGRLAGIIQIERKKYGRTMGIDYALAPEHRGRGIVTLACAAVVQYLFGESDVHRIELWVDVVNRKSCAVPERLGFSREGVHRHLALYANGVYGDIAVYALIKDDWSDGQQ